MQLKFSEATQILRRTPATLTAMVGGMPESWLKCTEGAGTWSAYDVVGHLIHGELTDWIPRVRIILDHQDRKAFDPFDRFAFKDMIAGRPVEQLLDEFAELRRQSLQSLRDLSIGEPQLELRGMHPELGPVTLGNLLATWVVHDLGHIAQVVKIMASEYRDAVGPWRAYLTILD